MYTEEDHLKGVNNNIKELYHMLKARIIDLGNDIQIKSNKRYIAFRRNYNFVAVKTRRSMLKLTLNLKKSELNDPLNKAREIESILSEVRIKEPNDIPYVLQFIQQSYEKSMTR